MNGLPPGVKLTHFQARVWAWLRSRAHLRQGICQAAETLAGIFGCSRRYVERALKLFVDLGVLRRVVDYGLRTRRRYYVVESDGEQPLFARCGEASPPNSLGALQCADSPHPSALTAEPPPDPPIEVSGESSKNGCGGGGPETPPPLDSFPSPPPEPTDDQVEPLVRQAQEALGETAPGSSWVRGLVRRFSLAWVAAALRRAQEQRRQGARIRTGYVVATLRGFEEEGVPPELLAPPPVRIPFGERLRMHREGRVST